MDHWWGSPGTSQSALELVDDSDVAMGVATAVMGYHGLAQGAVSASGAGLMDGVRLGEALDQLDLIPVAKAIAEATRPVMGDASEAYGILFAKDLHDRACASTQQVLASLVGLGVPWPVAIERVVLVHGVPADRLGQVSKHLRDVKASRPVLADAADRALLEHAKACGEREAGDVVSKAVRFAEREHPRDQSGRFEDKQAQGRQLGLKERRVDPAVDERRQRRQRRLRRLTSQAQQIEAMQARPKARESTPAPKGSLRAVQQAAAPKVKQAQASLQDQMRRFGMAGVAPAPVAEPGEQTSSDANVLFEDLTTARPMAEGEYRVDDAFVAFISYAELEEIARISSEKGGLGSISAAGFRQVFGRDLSFTTMANLGNQIEHARDGGMDMEEQARFGAGIWLRSDSLAFPDGYNLEDAWNNDSFKPADSVMLDMSHLDSVADTYEATGGLDESADVYAESEFYYHAKPFETWRGEVNVDISLDFVRTRMSGENKYGSYDRPKIGGVPMVGNKHTRLPDSSRFTFGFSYGFKEQEVKRDAHGRFADEGGIRQPATNEVEARRQRRMRRLGRLQRQATQIQEQQARVQQGAPKVAAPKGQLRSVSPMKQRFNAPPGRSLADQMQMLKVIQTGQGADKLASPLANSYALRFGADESALVGLLLDMIEGRGSDISQEDSEWVLDALKEDKRVGTADGEIIRMADMAMVGANRVTTVMNAINTDKPSVLSREEAIKSAEAEADRLNVVEQQHRSPSVHVPFITQVTEGVYTSHTFKDSRGYIGTQIVFDDNTIQEVHDAMLSGDWSTLKIEDDYSVGSNMQMLETGADVDPAEYPDAEVRVIRLSMRNNA